MRRDLYLPAFLVLCSGTVPAQTPAAGAELGRIVHLSAPSGPGSLAPNLSVGANGVLLSWLEPAARTGTQRSRRQSRSYALRWSRLEGDRWSDA